MEIKSILKTNLLLMVVLFLTSLGQLRAQIANSYPFDSLIHNDPDVIFVEMFEQDSVTNLLKGYTNLTNSANISFDSSVPPGSIGNQSGKFISYHTSNSVAATEIRKKFVNPISDSVFVRFYVKYNNTHTHHHSGIWLMGANPANPCFPCIYPNRTIPTGGDSAFQLGAELRGSTISPQTNSRFGLYNYWMGMHPNSSGVYYGNEFLNPPQSDVINTTQWNCIEIMLKLNNPTDSTGEAKLWINGQLIGHYGKGFPIGTWNQMNFTQGTGAPFEGFRWRSSSSVFNSIWIKNYSPVNTDTNANEILYDHIVVAKKYIGPISISYNLTSTTNVGGTISPAGIISAVQGSDKTFVIKPNTGYHIDSLIIDGVSVPTDTIYKFSNIQNHHSIKVVFAINTYTIIASSGDNGSISPLGNTVSNFGGNVQYTIHSSVGYHIDSLIVDNLPVTPDTVYSFLNIQSNHSIRAVFAIDVFNIQAWSGAGGSISPSGVVKVNYGDSITFAILADSAYYIQSIQVDGQSTGIVTNYSFASVKSNHTLQVLFNQKVNTAVTSLSNKLLIYPNPANNYFYIYNHCAEAEISLTDMKGRTVSVFPESICINKSFLLYQVKYLPDGLYFLLEKNNSSTTRYKILILHH